MFNFAQANILVNPSILRMLIGSAAMLACYFAGLPSGSFRAGREP
jgi:hypothetical protein